MADQRVTEHDRQVRNQRAMELHLAGTSYRKIADALNISVATAHEAVKSGLSDRRVEEASLAGDVVEASLARLDGMLMGLWPQARRGNVHAVDRVLKIEERRAQLLALRPSGAGESGEPTPPPTQLDEFRKRSADKRAGRT